MSYLRLLIENNITYTQVEGSPEVRVACPLCLDYKQRLYFNVEKGVGQCKNCSENFSATRFFDSFGVSIQETASSDAELIKLADLSLEVNIGVDRERYENSLTALVGIYNDLDLVDFHQVSAKPGLDELQARNLSIERAEELELSYCVSGTYKDRIIIPVRDLERRLVTFLARTADDDDKLRYMTAKGTSPTNVVGFLKKGQRKAIIVEGFFKAVHLDNEDVVFTMGKHVSKRQIGEMIRAGVDDITLIFDGNARSEMIKTANTLLKYFKVRPVFLPEDEEPDTLPRDVVFALINESKYSGTIEDMLCTVEYME